eukprot:6214689-Pleurochrysis_carterae.AAC.2
MRGARGDRPGTHICDKRHTRRAGHEGARTRTTCRPRPGGARIARGTGQSRGRRPGAGAGDVTVIHSDTSRFDYLGTL